MLYQLLKLSEWHAAIVTAPSSSSYTSHVGKYLPHSLDIVHCTMWRRKTKW